MEELNENQRRAVVGILEAKCRPKPYILFGPPGTGRSRKLIEAVVQIYRRSTGTCNVLVRAHSNKSADELLDRLTDELPEWVTKSLERSLNTSIPDHESCTVTTNGKAGCLIRVKLFDYVFIDDAGEGKAAESLVPACIVSPCGCLMLCDDFSQLSSTSVPPTWEERMGNWLLQRLAKLNIYHRDPTTASYNGDYITVLSDCYRSDARVLAPCHRKFGYNNLCRANKIPAVEDLASTCFRPLNKLSGAELAEASSLGVCLGHLSLETVARDHE